MRLENKQKRDVVRPRFAIGRLVFLVVAILPCFLWYYLELTAWHLAFYVILIIGLYASFTYHAINLMFYLTVMLLYWVIVPVFQIRTGVGYIEWTNEIPNFGPTALAYVTVHLFGVLLGYKFTSLSRPTDHVSSAQFSNVGVVLGIMLTVGLLSVVGFETVLLPRVEQGALEVSSYLLFLENVVKLMPAFVLLYFVLSKKKATQSNSTHFLTFIILILIQIIISNPVNTGRFISLYGFLLVGAGYLLMRSKISLLMQVVIYFPIYALFILAATSMMRTGLESFDLTRVFFYLQTLEFSSYPIFINAMSSEDVSRGNYLISHLLIFIPRAIWPSKADMIGADFAEPAGYVATNVGLHSFFNAYADYGYLGLLIISIFFGFITRKLNPIGEPAFFRNRKFVYGVILFCLMPMIFRGGLNTVMIAFYASIVSYEVIRYFTRFRVYR